MGDTNDLKILFVINPGAGSGDNSWQDIIRNYFTGKNLQASSYILEKTPDIDKLRKHIVEINPQKLVAVGGDGTFSLVAGLAAGTDRAVGIIPAGSANGMAKELGIPDDPEEALEIIENGDIKSCDAININNKNVCLHLSDIGLNAQLVKYFEEGKLRGKWGYARVVFKTLWRKRKMHVIMRDKNKEIRRDAFMVILANASKYGSGVVINPEGVLDDGLFEVVIIREFSFFDLVKMFIKPHPFNPKKIEILKATNLNIQTKRKVPFQIDGEYIGKVDKIEAAILPQYINIILPRATDEEAA